MERADEPKINKDIEFNGEWYCCAGSNWIRENADARTLREIAEHIDWRNKKRSEKALKEFKKLLLDI